MAAVQCQNDDIYDPDDVRPTSPQLQPVNVHFPCSRSPSPDTLEDEVSFVLDTVLAFLLLLGLFSILTYKNLGLR